MLCEEKSDHWHDYSLNEMATIL